MKQVEYAVRSAEDAEGEINLTSIGPRERQTLTARNWEQLPGGFPYLTCFEVREAKDDHPHLIGTIVIPLPLDAAIKEVAQRLRRFKTQNLSQTTNEPSQEQQQQVHGRRRR